jgi:hypothetical protein
MARRQDTPALRSRSSPLRSQAPHRRRGSRHRQRFATRHLQKELWLADKGAARGHTQSFECSCPQKDSPQFTLIYSVFTHARRWQVAPPYKLRRRRLGAVTAVHGGGGFRFPKSFRLAGWRQLPGTKLRNQVRACSGASAPLSFHIVHHFLTSPCSEWECETIHTLVVRRYKFGC